MTVYLTPYLSSRGVRGAALALLLPVLAGTAAAAQGPREVNVPAVDYPAGVQPGAREYRVRIRYELDASGHIATCSVVHSSGQPGLDAESCRIFQLRARIRPESGRMRGLIDFDWLGRASLDRPYVRGEPLPYSFAQVIADTDYPAEALRRGESGTVQYEVTVSATGAPRVCRVTQSSGSAALDRRTCDLVMTRSAYIAATDGGGLVDGIAHGRISWMLPD